MPGMLLFAMVDANRLFLNAFELTRGATIIVVLGLPVHVLLCYSFVFKLGMGVYGVCMAMFINYSSMLLALTTYSSCQSEISEAWFWPSGDSF
jgi:Na+-driven multidrug efflux pump